MSYLDRLKQIDAQKTLHGMPNTVLTKPTKDPFVSSVSTPRGVSVKIHNSGALAQQEASAILSWLTRIGESDPVITVEIMTACATDPDALRYFLRRSKEAST